MSHETGPGQIPGGTHRDSADQTRLRHARDRHLGFQIGQYLQPPPMIFTRDGHNAFLGDMFRGRSAFLICSGPSLATHELSHLRNRGVLTLSVNNAATVVQSNLWTCVDDPGHFSDVIWRDPGITKFVPLCHMEKHFQVRDADGLLVPSKERVGDMPAVFGFRRNERFLPKQWLYEDTFNWGNRSDLVDEGGDKGSRSVMYVALRLLFYLGVRRIYLLGCDFKMELGKQNYAFPQDRTAASVRGNNSSYQILNRRLQRLRPHFESAGLKVVNCTPNSGLTVFPYQTYERALAEISAEMPQRIITEGMYDGRHVRTAPQQGRPPAPSPENKHPDQVREKLQSERPAPKLPKADPLGFTVVTPFERQLTDVTIRSLEVGSRLQQGLRPAETLVVHALNQSEARRSFPPYFGNFYTGDFLQ